MKNMYYMWSNYSSLHNKTDERNYIWLPGKYKETHKFIKLFIVIVSISAIIFASI